MSAYSLPTKEAVAAATIDNKMALGKALSKMPDEIKFLAQLKLPDEIYNGTQEQQLTPVVERALNAAMIAIARGHGYKLETVQKKEATDGSIN